MAEKKKSGNPSKPRKKKPAPTTSKGKQTKRTVTPKSKSLSKGKNEKMNTTEKVFVIIMIVSFAFLIAFMIYMICDHYKWKKNWEAGRTEEKTEERTEERKLPEIKESEIPEIKKQYKKMCDFYLNTASVTDVTLDNENQSKEYLLETFKKYLELVGLIPDEARLWSEDRDDFLSDFIFDIIEEEKVIRIKAELIRRWKLIIEIQEILKSKLEEARCESEDYLSHFVDGRPGEKTKELASAILRSTPSGRDWYWKEDNYILMGSEELFKSSQSTLSSLFEFLKQGKLEVATIELPESTGDYAHALQEKIKEYKVTQEDRDYKKGEIIRQKIKQAMNFINEQKKEVLKSAKSEEEKIEKGKALMLIAVNYVVKSWEGFPASTHHGWARYPYDKRGESNRNYIKIDCSTYIKRIVETLFPELNERYSCVAQEEPWQQLEIYAKFLGISIYGKERNETDKLNKIFMIDGTQREHMRLIFADLQDNADFAVIKVSEASGGSVKNRIMIMKNEDEDSLERTLEGTVNVSSVPAVKKWLLNN